MRVVLVDAVQQRGIAVIENAETYLRQQPRVVIVALCHQLFRARYRHRRLDCQIRLRTFICLHCRNLGNAAVIRQDGGRGKTGHGGELVGESRGAGFKMQALQLELRCCES